jgi:hypothetical protein
MISDNIIDTMNRSIKILLILVLTALVTSIPITGAVTQNTVLDNEKQRIADTVKQKFIDTFGQEAHIELHNDITVAVYSWFYNYCLYDYPEANGGYVVVLEKSLERDRNIDTTDYEGLVNLLIAWCELVAEICWLAFGHGDLGMGMAYVICLLLFFFPCRLTVLAGMMEDNTFMDDLMELLNDLNLDQFFNFGYFFYQYGILGGIIVLMILSPALIVLLPLVLAFLLFSFPLVRLVNTLDLLLYITSEVFT